MKSGTIERTAHPDELSVEHWRERFPTVFKRFKNMTEAAEELARLDEDFEGIAGYNRLQNAKRGIAGLRITAKAVKLMELLRPEEDPKPTYLGRQKLKKV